MKIFIGLTEIAGYYSNLKLGFDQLGAETCYVNLSPHIFSYKVDKSNQPVFVRFVEKILHRPVRSKAHSVLNIFLRKIFAVLLFVWALPRYDVFIFGNACRMFPYDLPILKFFNKKIIWIFHGGDARPIYIDGGTILTSDNLTPQECLNLTKKQKSQVNYIDKYADFVINNLAGAHFHLRPVVQWINIGIPHALNKNILKPEIAKSSKIIKILHSPSNRKVKGSDLIALAINNLKLKNYNIDYVEITGRPNSEVIKEISTCDFVVDQLYSDTYMAGFATEAAWFGKPAIVGGYAKEELDRFVIPEDRPPTHYCHPDEIEHAIEKLITDTTYRLSLGKRAYEFVSTRWTPKQVAGNILKLIKEDYPQHWLFDPKELTFAHGGCMPDDMAKHMVKALIELDGVEALCLSDKPQLEALFIEFANS
ncbi:MAG: hypothetical protein KIH69_002520 [Anaerolineae bacterium]|nr:hypothetical protein [Anaerolineae bacterium]